MSTYFKNVFDVSFFQTLCKTDVQLRKIPKTSPFLWKIDTKFSWKQCWLTFAAEKNELLVFLGGNMDNSVNSSEAFLLKLEHVGHSGTFSMTKESSQNQLNLDFLFRHGFYLLLKSAEKQDCRVDFISPYAKVRDWFADTISGKNPLYPASAFSECKSYFAMEKQFKKSIYKSNSFSNIKDNKDINRDLTSFKRKIRLFIMSWNLAVRKLLPSNKEQLKKQIPKDCDVYVFGVQECINLDFFRSLSDILPHCTELKLKTAKLFGRGDRSFISPKFTGIGIFVSKELQANSEIKDSSAVSISKLEGSKGSAGFVMTIHSTTLAFVSSHFPVKSVDYRSLCYQYLDEQLGIKLGNKKFSLFRQFHHVFYMGDYNYKLLNINMNTALKMIQSESLNTLRLHDSLSSEIEAGRSFYGVREPLPMPNFYPTYKKIETRPEHFDCNEPGTHYLTIFKKPWYKRSAVVEKIPAFTDRIFVGSLNCFSNDVSPEPLEGACHRYGCFDPDFVGSDHSAIFSVMDVKIRYTTKLKKPQRLRVTIRSIMVRSEDLYEERPPNSGLFMFPAPYEDNSGKGSPAEIIFLPFTEEKHFQIAAKFSSRNAKKRLSKARKEKVKEPQLLEKPSEHLAEDLDRESSYDEDEEVEKVEKKHISKSRGAYAHETFETLGVSNDYLFPSVRVSDPGRPEVASGGRAKDRKNINFDLDSQPPREVTLEWSTFSTSPVLNMVVRLATDGQVGQCTIPMPFSCFANRHSAEVSEELCVSGVPLRNERGKRLMAHFLMDFTVG